MPSMCEIFLYYKYMSLEPEAITSKLKYIQCMWTQVVACVFSINIYAAIMTLLVCRNYNICF
jgi:hypothetical protein